MSHLKSKELWDLVSGNAKVDSANIKNDEKAKFIILAAMEDQQINRTGKCDTSHDL